MQLNTFSFCQEVYREVIFHAISETDPYDWDLARGQKMVL